MRWEDEYVVLPKERFEELEKLEKSIDQIVFNGTSQLKAVREQLVEARKALEFYADRRSWRSMGAYGIKALGDGGRRARKILGIV